MKLNIVEKFQTGDFVCIWCGRTTETMSNPEGLKFVTDSRIDICSVCIERAALAIAGGQAAIMSGVGTEMSSVG